MPPSQWKQTSDQRLVIEESAGWMRRVFGGLLAAAGAFFSLAWVVGLFRPGGLQAALANPLNALAVLGMALFFLAVGWLAASWRRSMVLDKAAGELWEVNDFLLFKRARKQPLESFFRLVLLTGQAGDPPAPFYSLRLVRPDKDWTPLLANASIVEAREVGERVAELLGMELIEMSQKRWDGVVGKRKG